MIQKDNLLSITAAILILLLSSCDPLYNCLDGNGRILSENRQVGSFSGVNNNTSFTVRVSRDSIYSVRVDADENLIKSIHTYTEDDVLIIENQGDRCINSAGPVLIDIHVPELNKVIQNGSGNISADNFTSNYMNVENSGSGYIDLKYILADEIDIHLSGSGIITISGTSAIGNYTLSGSGRINADKLKLINCIALISGSGDVSCHVTDNLEAGISGSGIVYYHGDPLVIKNISGSGRVVKLD
jgi:hypothetical protein